MAESTDDLVAQSEAAAKARRGDALLPMGLSLIVVGGLGSGVLAVAAESMDPELRETVVALVKLMLAGAGVGVALLVASFFRKKPAPGPGAKG